MLFMCGWPAYRGTHLTFLYAFLEPPPDQHLQPLQHSVRFGVDAPPRQLTAVPGPMTPDWLAATDIEAARCILNNRTTLADLESQLRQRPLLGNFTTHTFNITDTYQVKAHSHWMRFRAALYAASLGTVRHHNATHRIRCKRTLRFAPQFSQSA